MTTTIETVGDLTIHSWITGSGGHQGGITKTGAGMLTLTNAGNDYTGHTVVNAGTLSFSNPTLADSADVAYAIQTSTTLAAGSWVTVTPTVNSPSLISYTLSSGLPKVFARLVVTKLN